MCHQISLLKLTFELFYALVWNLPICFPQNSKHLLIQSQFLGHFALVSSGIEVIYPQQILMVCSSCKTSYNIISHTHAITCGIGQFVRLLQSRRSTLKCGGGGGDLNYHTAMRMRQNTLGFFSWHKQLSFQSSQ